MSDEILKRKTLYKLARENLQGRIKSHKNTLE